MAEDDNFQSERFRKTLQNSADSDNSDIDEPIKLDLGIDLSLGLDRLATSEGAAGILILIFILNLLIEYYIKRLVLIGIMNL